MRLPHSPQQSVEEREGGVTLIWLSLVRKMLRLLRSRCTMRFEWRCCNACVWAEHDTPK